MNSKVVFAGSLLMAGAATRALQAEEWHATAGAESPDRGSQALAFLPNEFWVHTGDSIRWTFPTQERHTLTFLTPGQVRPPRLRFHFGVSRSGVQVLHPMDPALTARRASTRGSC